MTQKLESKAVDEVDDREFNEIVMRNLEKDRQLLSRLAKV